MHHAKSSLMLKKEAQLIHSSQFCLLWKRRWWNFPSSQWHHTCPESSSPVFTIRKLSQMMLNCSRWTVIRSSTLHLIWFITEQKPSLCITYRLVWWLSGLFGWLCVNWEADVQTISQRAIAESELWLGLRVSLLTANWHSAPAIKLHHQDPKATACTVRLLTVCVVSWSRILLENHRWKTRWTQNLLNMCDGSLIDSVFCLWMTCYNSIYGMTSW